jgi:D-serine deaminase-like pyridoxal phosphate-dependent protein
MQMEAGAIGISVAKVSEAEVLVSEGFSGVLITSPVVTASKIQRLMGCLSRDSELMVVVDNLANARKLNDEAARKGLALSVLVDLDPGMGRTGVPYDQGLALGELVTSLPSLRLRGIQCYAGHLQHIASFEERRGASLGCMENAGEVVSQFREKGLPCEIFTGAGTGTHEIDCLLPDLTDLQVGSYVMMDADYLSIGSSQDPARFSGFPAALTLLTTVVSANRNEFVTVDAGLKALYHDGGTPYVVHPPGLDGEYRWYGDEHGMVVLRDQDRRPELGQVLELVVSHCDPTVNLFDDLYVVRDGVVEDVWPIDMRGKSQ